MKNLTLLSLLLLAVYASAFAASADFPIHLKPRESFSQGLRIVNIYDLKEDGWNEIIQGNYPELAVEFTTQTRLPIHFFLKGDFLHLTESPERIGNIEIKQTFYARCVEKELVLSSNLTDWKPFLEFITGTASVALSMQEGQPSIVIGVEANQRL
jgi:hypothetical protein